MARTPRRLMSETQRKAICSRIEQLPIDTKPSWKNVIDIAFSVTGHAYTRQGLNAVEPIKEALLLRVSQNANFVRDGTKPASRVSADDLDPNEKIHREVRSQLSDARETIRLYDEMLATIIHNATARGMTIEELQAPLSGVERDRTDELSSAQLRKKKR